MKWALKNKHMKKGIIILLSVLFSTSIFSQVKSIQERLGYPKDAKLVIIHADDLGVSHVDSVYQTASAAEVEEEIRNQVIRAKQFGVDPTHLDAHMGTALQRLDYF